LHGNAITNDQSISHDGLTFVIPAPQKSNLITGKQTGRWADLGTGPEEPVTMDVFNLSIEHGPHPKNATYTYFVFAGDDHSADIEILSNTPQLQAVRCQKLKLTGVAFWQPGKLEAGPTIEADQPCLVLVGEKRVSVSTPKNQPLTVNISFDGGSPITFDLPGGAMAGSTVSKEFGKVSR
jgi:hypothetical protein